MRAATLLVLFVTPVFAQLETDTITIDTVSPVLWQRGQLSVGICVSAKAGKTIDEVLAAVKGLPISERDLQAVDQNWNQSNCQIPDFTDPALRLYWRFAYSVPIAKLTETLAALARLSGAAPSGFSMAYEVESRRNGAALECAFPTLVSQARRHAEAVAGAAGLRVGAAVAMSDGGDIEPAQGETGAPFLQQAGNAGIAMAPITIPTCNATVQFKLLR
jgi:hypothetical protein